MDLGNSREQTATEIIIDTQTEIKMLVKKAIRSITINFKGELDKLLETNLKDIKNEELRETARKSLERFAYDELRKTSEMIGLGNLPLIVAFAQGVSTSAKKQIQAEIDIVWDNVERGTLNNAFSQLGNSQAMVRNNQSLYGHSELVARYEERENMLNRLRERTNLVVCDTHSDCSDRCFPWQGRVYSLDGTTGYTSDGRKYVPLEEATDVVDKYGYKNGLLGFNCRHKLVAYKDGLRPNKVTKKEQRIQNELTAKQRLLEREIRYSKDLAIGFKGIDKDKFKYYSQKARNLTVEYRQFCRDNNRVEYRSRLQI